MLASALTFVVLFVLAVAFAWLAWRATRAGKTWVRWVGAVAATLPALLLAVVAAIVGIGAWRLYAPRGNPPPMPAVERTADRVARGQHLAAVSCSPCHSTDASLPLSGDRDLAAEIPLPIGTIVTPNLTPGGHLPAWSDGEIARAIREAADPDGRPLVIMATQQFRNFSRDDLEAIVAYLRSQPTVDASHPPESLTPVAAILVGVGLFPLPPPPSPDAWVTPPPKERTVAYGQYVAVFNDCVACHGRDLTGGTNPLGPPGPNLRVVKGWSEAQFADTLRTGVNPSGRRLNPDLILWPSFGQLDDEELGALYAYLISLS